MRASGESGGGGGIVLDASTARTIRNRFDDLAAEFRNTRTPLAAHYRGMTEGAASWPGRSRAARRSSCCRGTTSSTSARPGGLIAGNVNNFAIDLEALDSDARTSIVLSARQADGHTDRLGPGSGERPLHLDVDPSRLRAVAAQLDELSAHVRTKAGRVSATPDEIGDRWQGRAAASVKQNMSALGAQMDRYDERFHQAATALRGLAGEYEHALEVKVPELDAGTPRPRPTTTPRWGAPTASTEAATGDLNGGARDAGRAGRIAQPRRERRLRGPAAGPARARVDYGHYKELLRQKTRAASDALASAVVVEVSDAQVEEFPPALRGSGPSQPDEHRRPRALRRHRLHPRRGRAVRRRRPGGRRAARGDPPRGGRSEDEIAAYVARLEDVGSGLPEGLRRGPRPGRARRAPVLHHFTTGDDTTGQGQIVTAVAQILAQGSNADVQGDYPVDSGAYDKLLDAYAGWGTSEGEAHAPRRGRARGPGWHRHLGRRPHPRRRRRPRLRAGAGRGIRRLGLEPGQPRLASGHRGRPRDYGDSNLMDPLAMVLDSMHHDPVAAQDFLTQDAAADTDTLHYLYDRTAGQYFDAFGYSLGGLLDSATTFVGAGGLRQPRPRLGRDRERPGHLGGGPPGPLAGDHGPGRGRHPDPVHAGGEPPRLHDGSGDRGGPGRAVLLAA